jgi:hypothetical protein
VTLPHSTKPDPGSLIPGQLARTPPGRDAAGAVLVWLDDDGLARQVRLVRDWRSRVDLADLGAAVVAADADAADQLARTILNSLSTVEHPEPPKPPMAPDAQPGLSLDALITRAIAAVDGLDRVSQVPVSVEGRTPDNAVRMLLSGGRLTACTIDPGRLSTQDVSAVAAALARCLEAARVAHARARQSHEDVRRELDDVLAGLMATLRDMSGGPGR